MRVFAFSAAFMAILLAVSAAPVEDDTDKNLLVVAEYKQGDKCPAQQFYVDCNYCFCLDNGHNAGCFMKNCDKEESRTRRDVSHNEEDIPVVYNYYKKGIKKCPAKVFYDDCNRCVCLADGKTAACTFKLCPKSQEVRARRAAPVLPHIDNFVQVQECTPGQVFIDVCNRCQCGPDGQSAACTKMACPPAETRIDDYEQGKSCPAGKTFLHRCNTCHCGSDGRSASCAFKACV